MRVGGTAVHHVEHGDGTPVLVLHGAGVDHREAEACFEPGLGARPGLRRIYPDLPGTGLTPAPDTVRGADDVLDVLLAFVDEVAGEGDLLVAGHSAGAYYGRAIASTRAARTAGLALVCPLLAEARDVPAHRPVVADPELGDDGFREYFVVQTPAMLDRYERFVAPALPLADDVAAERIGERWELTSPVGSLPNADVLVVAGRQDSVVGSAAAADLAERYPRASLAVLDGAGHALPHERLGALTALLEDWAARILAR